jgi:hypothetical protein
LQNMQAFENTQHASKQQQLPFVIFQMSIICQHCTEGRSNVTLSKQACTSFQNSTAPVR